MGAYEKLAPLYDEMMSDTPYLNWTEYLIRIWRKLGKPPKKVLDLACGTGNIACILAEKGFQVTGIDLSKQMLKVAKEKTDQVKFKQGDMRKLKTKQKFDSVIILYDSLNYLILESEIRKTFQNIHRALNRKGTLIFDVYTPHKILNILGNTSSCADYENFHVCWHNNVDPETNTNTLILEFFVKKRKKYERFTEIHNERAYPVQFLKKALEKEDFKVNGVWDALTFNQPKPNSKRIYFAATKKG